MTTYFYINLNGGVGAGNWSNLSGGVSNGATPTSTIDVVFDNLSSAIGYTVTPGNFVSFDCLSITTTAPASGNLTFSNNSLATFTVYGTINFYSGMLFSSTGALNLGGANSSNITTNGASIPWPINVSGVGSTWTLQDNLTITKAFTHTKGTFAWNGKTLTVLNFTSNGSSTRVLDMTNGNLTVTGALNNTTPITFTTTGLTVTNTGSTVQVLVTNNNSNGTAFPCIFAMGGVTLNNFTITNPASYDMVAFSGNVTCVGTFTVTGSNRHAGRFFIFSTVPGTARTINAAVVALTNVDFQDVTAAGAASPFTGTSIGNAGGNTNITADTPRDCYWKSGTGDIADETKWVDVGAAATAMPLPQDTCKFNAASFTAGSQAVTFAPQNYRIGSVDFTGATNTPSFNINKYVYFYGHVTYISAMTLGTHQHAFAGRGSFNYTQGGVTNNGTSTDIDCVTGTYSLQGNVSFVGASNIPNLFLLSGGFDANDYNLVLGTFDGSNSRVRSLLMGNGTWTLAGSLSPWAMTTTTNLTFNAENSTIVLTDGTVSTKTFAGGGLTYYNFSNQGTGSGGVNFTGSNTFHNFDVTIAGNQTMRMTAGTTQTMVAFTSNSAVGRVLTFTSVTASSHNLTLTGGGTVSADYMTISQSHALPTLTWYAGTHSTDSGSNTGWIFTAPPSTSAFVQVIIVAG